MFTGVIEETGAVSDIKKEEHSLSLVIAAPEVAGALRPGDSIAINGVCLTVTSSSKDLFTADVMPETLRLSNLGKLVRGSHVNLERALPANGRLDGHIVMGHIDGTGTLVSFKREENAVWVHIRTDKNLLRYLVYKGSVAVDGISLTVARLEEDGFYLSLIPFTRNETTLIHKKPGETVNIECDILGKYVERMLVPATGKKPTLSHDFLKDNGFF